jgi:hypothetical protein
MDRRDWLWVALAVSVVVNVLLAGIAAKTRPVDVADTIVVRDTVRVVEPILVTEEVVRYEKVLLPVVDTIVRIDTIVKIDARDSVEVVVPITEKTYEDSAYKAVVRGYNPELVSLDIYNSTKTITITKTKKAKVVVSAGVYGGFGSKGADYGLGVMVGVPIWSW